MQKMSTGKLIQMTLFVIFIVGVIANAAILIDQTRDAIPRIELLEARYRKLKVEQYSSYRYVDAIAQKVLTPEEYASLKAVVEADREELERILSNNDDK